MAKYNEDKPWLKNFADMTPEERKELGRKGGKKAAEKRELNKTFKKALEWALDMPAYKGNPTVNKVREQFPGLTNRDAMAISMVNEAIRNGNVKAFLAVRDTTGELPEQLVNVKQDKAIKIEVSVLDDDTEEDDED